MELFNKNKKLFQKRIFVNSNKKRDIIYDKESFNFKIGRHFSGSSPPEIFVGRYNYPNVNAGILSPDFFENTEELSMPEIWYEKNFSIGEILAKRNKLVYGRFKAEIKKTNKFIKLMQEISMAYKPVSTEFFLKKPPKKNLEINKFSPIITNQAPLEFARLQENPKIKSKVDYLVSDTDNKAVNSVIELHQNNIPISNINKILSAGLLGLKNNRRLVPTRWSITAVDDIISKNLLRKIRHYKEINDILVFNSEYNGNHYEILLLPDKFSFEVIEAEIKFFGNSLEKVNFWKDHEFFYDRKNYADQVVGAYYANRLALCEYLDKIKKQASALFLREIHNYYAHLGVGILRETCRDAFSKTPEKFDNLAEAFKKIQERLILNFNLFREKSVILNEYGKQVRLSRWF
ncbi:MAG: hypothetical protein AABW90_03945 [Nanoarchaeota archaeon]